MAREDRRRFLKRGVFGGALMAFAGGAGLLAWPAKLVYAPKRALKVLDPPRFAVLASIAARTVTAPGADPAEIAHRIDDFLAVSAPEIRGDVGGLLWLLESALIGAVLDGRFRPFTRLEGAEQDRVLYAWRDSSLVIRRGGYHALRKLTLRAHYQSPETWESVGYGGPPGIAGEE